MMSIPQTRANLLSQLETHPGITTSGLARLLESEPEAVLRQLLALKAEGAVKHPARYGAHDDDAPWSRA